MRGLSVLQGALVARARTIVLQPFERLFTPLSSRLGAATGIDVLYELLNWRYAAQQRFCFVTRLVAAASAAVLLVPAALHRVRPLSKILMYQRPNHYFLNAAAGSCRRLWCRQQQ
jgi:hypothetical protein